MAAEETEIKLMTELYNASLEKVLSIGKQQLKLEGLEGKPKIFMINRIREGIEKQLETIDNDDKLDYLINLLHLVADVPPPLEEKKEVTVKTDPSPQKLDNSLHFDGTSVLRRQFKIMGQIGENDQRDKLTYNSLVRQIKTGISQGYKESEVVDAVIRSIVPGIVLRSYLESFQDLPLDRLKRILRSHYGVKNSSELYQTLASLCQNTKEAPQSFLMRALDLRQKILFTNEEGDDELKYDAEHIQQLFLRAVETGLLDENIRIRMRPFLSQSKIQDEELIHQLNTAVAAEGERDRKLKALPRSKHVCNVNTQVESSTVQKPKRDPPAPNDHSMASAIDSLRAELAALRSEMNTQNRNNSTKPEDSAKSQNERGSTKARPKCSTCKENNVAYCSHCYKCGSDNHFAAGCRQSQPRQQLNDNRLSPRDGR